MQRVYFIDHNLELRNNYVHKHVTTTQELDDNKTMIIVCSESSDYKVQYGSAPPPSSSATPLHTPSL